MYHLSCSSCPKFLFFFSSLSAYASSPTVNNFLKYLLHIIFSYLLLCIFLSCPVLSCPVLSCPVQSMSIDDGSSYPLGTTSEVGPVLKVSSSDWNDHWERPVSYWFLPVDIIFPVFADFFSSRILPWSSAVCQLLYSVHTINFSFPYPLASYTLVPSHLIFLFSDDPTTYLFSVLFWLLRPGHILFRNIDNRWSLRTWMFSGR